MTIAIPDLSAVLDGIVRRHGTAVLADRARLFGLLRDYAPHALREVRVLMTAFDAGTAERLRDETDPTAPAAIAAEARRVTEASGCRPDLSEAAVRAWAGLLARLAAPEAVQPLPSVVRPLPPDPPPPGPPGLLARILGRT